MTHYFFDLHECGTLFQDDEGQEVLDADLRGVALKEARALMAAEVIKGELCLSCSIEVLDISRRPVLSVPFRDAVKINGL